MVANGFEGVPWMVGGGAKHSANIGRVLAFMACGGQSGIAAPGDLKISQSGTADKFVHMATGALSVVNRAGNARNEAYIGRATAVSDIEIAPTGSSARSDLIVARIKDPQYNQSITPASVADGPYVFPEIISGVASNIKRVEQLNLSEAVYAVARIDIPPNTTAITSAMIKDLRQLAQPHSHDEDAIQSGTTWAEWLLTSDTNWKNWPNNALQLDVPPWATHAFVRIDLNAVGLNGVPADFSPRINLGGLTAASPNFDYNGSPPGAGAEKLPFTLFAQFDVRSLAGQTVTLRPQAARIFATTSTGEIWFDPNSQVIFSVKFQERPV